MLSYQHSYHAGNYADVLKHLTLMSLIRYLTTKDKSLLYLETHAGRGRYDLQDKQALKTGEASSGIDLLWRQRAQLPEVFTPYLDLISGMNQEDSALRYYPGSPYLAIHALRQIDRIVCAELHPGEFAHLKQLPREGKNVVYKQSNGLDELKALLPPPERRGLIFIDPSYEIKTDYRQVPELVQAAVRRFATGVYCIWYPIVDKQHHASLIKGLSKIQIGNQPAADTHLCIEFYLNAHQSPQSVNAPSGMDGCGLWIVNPPFTLAAEMKVVLEVLCQVFNPGYSRYTLRK